MQMFTSWFIKHELHKPKSSVFLTAEREEMISCVYVSRDEERVAVAFSRPVNVSIFTCVYEMKLYYSDSFVVTHISQCWVHFFKTLHTVLFTNMQLSITVNLKMQPKHFLHFFVPSQNTESICLLTRNITQWPKKHKQLVALQCLLFSLKQLFFYLFFYFQILLQ